MGKKKENHYVSNKEFFDEMVEFKKDCEVSEQEGKPYPQVPECIAKKIMLIAERLSYRPNFINYTYRDEMISDAIENCLLYIRNFNPEKSNNPFAYYSQICYYAFLRRIQKEKKQFHTKVKFVQQSCVLGMGAESSSQGHDSESAYANSYRDFMRDFYDVELEEDTPKRTRTRKQDNTIDVTKTQEELRPTAEDNT